MNLAQRRRRSQQICSTGRCRQIASSQFRMPGSERGDFPSGCERAALSRCVVGRYYDPSTDQFLSVDPEVGVTGQPYAYDTDDPLNETDPLGLVGGCTTNYCGPDSGEIVGPSGRGCTENCNPGPPSSPGACNADCGPGSVGPTPGSACGSLDPSYCALVLKAVESGNEIEVECLTGLINCWDCPAFS